MYEELSYEIILSRMLARVPDTIDKREGSIIYDTLAPCAMEMMLMYLELNNVINETFGDTASREYLIKRAAERGLEPSAATYAILKGEFNQDVPIGSRFSLSTLNYEVTEKIEDFSYKMQCETIGSEGNENYGTLIPIDYIDGLTTATLTELLIPGEDEEDTEDFRERYYNSFESASFGGNQADYIEKTNEIAGVGGVKVYPTWDGGGTVKLVIINSEFSAASDELIEFVQQSIDPTDSAGEGVGFAPIGHEVTVVGVDEVEIDVQADFTYTTGFDFQSSVEAIKTAIEEYLLELRKNWDSEESLIVRISGIESKLLDLPQLIDIESTTINTSSKNVVLGADDIPILGEVSENE